MGGSLDYPGERSLSRDAYSDLCGQLLGASAMLAHTNDCVVHTKTIGLLHEVGQAEVVAPSVSYCSVDQSAASTLPPVSAIVLAAGKAERMGFSKLGLQLAGQSILSRVVNTALASCVSEVVVVLGHFAEELAAEIPPSQRAKVVHNQHYEQGQHSSLKAGLAAVDAQAAAVVVLLGDQPLVTTEAIDAVVDEFQRRRAPIVVPIWNGRRGHPVLFSRALFPELMTASEDQGRREVMRRYQAESTTVTIVGEPPKDVDTWQDYVSLSGQTQEPRALA